MRAILGFTLALVSLQAHAGAWVSSGGEIFNDGHNPWFVNNVRTVHYCIESSDAGVSARRPILERAINEAISYWKTEFASARLPKIQSIPIATQDFVQESCSGMEDLRFKFGYETLTSEQVQKLGNPRRYAAVAVRTDYDETNLVGKGFIFVASDLGPNAYDSNGGELISNAWRSDRLLVHVLVHELGHVFGLPHVGTGIMSEVFMEQVLSKKYSWLFSGMKQTEPFFNPPALMSDCQPKGFQKEFFNLPSNLSCLVLKSEQSPFSGSITVYGGNSPGDMRQKLGYLGAEPIYNEDVQARPAVVLRLTRDQKYIDPSQTDGSGFVLGAALWDFGVQGTYYVDTGSITSGPRKPVYLRVTPGSLHVMGTSGDAIRGVFNYQSALGDWLVAPN